MKAAIERLGPLNWTSPLPDDVAENMNGATLMRVPDWVAAPLGRYYLYFAHHAGRYIRFAHADRIEGPWTLREGGVLDMGECPWAATHIASPDIRIDHDAQRIDLYFHGDMAEPKGQFTFRAESNDGVTFRPEPNRLGTFYFRTFDHGGEVYALGKARLYRSTDGGRSFEVGHLAYPLSPETPGQMGPQALRHSAVIVEGDLAHVVFSRLEDAPESLRYGRMALSGDWRRWMISDCGILLAPDAEFEGGALEIAPSDGGVTYDFVRQLRDPHVLWDEGAYHLVYSYGGESGLALARFAAFPEPFPARA